ncbi:MAG: 6-hydroxycyclohex-1-ene-1-carbonyl-CoA dehydrogenase [Gemmatimonadota bacterium]
MKALQLVTPSAPLELRDVPRPVPGPDDVLVRVAGCGVCHTDIGFWRDGVPTRGPLPLTLGHEIAGTVEEAGSAFSHLVGREVIVPAVIPCLECELCRSGRSNVCRSQVMPGNDMDGGFAEFVRVPARGLCLVEDRAGFELAELAVVADAVTTPYQAIVRSGLGEGDLAIIVGVGGVGTHCVQIAHAVGARTVALDVDASRLDAIRAFGADEVLDTSALDFKTLRRRVRETASTWGIPEHGWKVFECSGHPAGQETAYGLLTYASTLMVVGFTLAKIELRLSNLMAFDAAVLGTWGCRPELYPEALALVTQGRIALRPFIETHALDRGSAILTDAAEHRLARRAILVPERAH